MNPSQLVPMDGYTQSFGTKQACVAELAGPSSYPTGGQEVEAASLGWGGFDAVAVMGLSYSGTYYAHVQYLPVDAAPSGQKPPVQSVKILWYVLATGAEVANTTDIDGEILRLFCIGV